jgi:hypothetical protein
MKDVADRYRHEKLKEYIAGEQFDYCWTKRQIERVKQMYTDGCDIRDIADKVRKTEYGDIEVFLLLADLICKGKLEEREGKIFGKGGEASE